MAARIFDFQIEGMTEPVKLGSMSWKRAKEFVKQGQLLLGREDVTADEWTERRDLLVQESFERAGGSGDVTDLFDGDQLNQMQIEIMEWSGLKTKSLGEVPAASISTGSKAA